MEHLGTNVNNNTISYFSKSSGQPFVTVVFIHGFPFDKTIWTKQLEGLPDGVKGIAYDIRGFSESSTGHHFFSVDLFARDLISFIDNLGIETCVLCGISMGGYIALRAMEIASFRIKGLILCDTNSVADSNEGKIKRFKSIEQILNGEKEDFTESFIQNVFHSDTVNEKKEVVQFLREIIMRVSNNTICAAQLALASRTDTSKSLENIDIPVLILRGEDDKIISAEQTTQLASGISNSSIVTISKSGHLPNLENVTDFNSSINSFLSKHFLS